MSKGCPLWHRADLPPCIRSLSKCVYDKTKITKGVGQVEVMGRAEAFTACKPKCAKSKSDISRGNRSDAYDENGQLK